MIESMIIAGVGGFFGTACRYLAGIAGKKFFGDKYPAGTFFVNVVGCFIIGILAGLWTRHEMSAEMNALLITGFCGGLTTFSSFSHDAFAMIQKGEWIKFILYVVPSVALGLLFVWLGMSITDWQIENPYHPTHSKSLTPGFWSVSLFSIPYTPNIHLR